jgi:hypothetical protein
MIMQTRFQGPMQQLSVTKALLIAVWITSVILASVISGYLFYMLPTQNQKPRFGLVSSNVFLVTMNDTTVNRAFNTTYRSLQTNVIYCQVYVKLNTSAANSVMAFAEVNQTALYLNRTRSVRGVINSTAAAANATMLLAFYVPPLFYYRVNSTTRGGGTALIRQWLESIPPTGFGFDMRAIAVKFRRFIEV